MSVLNSFDPLRDADEIAYAITPLRTPWRRRAVETIDERSSGCRDCGEKEESTSNRRAGLVPRGDGAFSFLRGNRSLVILLIDTVIVMALFFVVLFVYVPSIGRVRIADMRIETMAADEGALVVVRAEFLRRRGDQEGPETRIIALAAAGEVLRDLAPSAGQRRILELRIPRDRLDDEVVIDVFVADEQRRLTRPIVD